VVVVIRVLPALVELGLLVFCLIECIQAPEGEIRALPRWAWIVLILLVPLVGGIAWLVAGRPLRRPGAGRTAAWPSGPTAGFPEYQRPPRGPDDDSEFLAGIGRADREHEDVLRRWEEDLRHREEKLKAQPGDPGPDPATTDDEDPPPVRS
jgi:Phospholipase_D-nuclease N-terminal